MLVTTRFTLLQTILWGITLLGGGVVVVVLQQQHVGWTLPRTTAPAQSSQPTLFYRPQNADNNETFVFRILQIADIHLGECADTDWGPQQDVKTWKALDRILAAEQRDGLDLLVLSGDQITAGDINQNATAYYQQLAERLSSYGVPFAMTFGNHDDDGYNYHQPYKRPAHASRAMLLQTLQSFDLSLTQAGPPQVFGVSNYWLNIHVGGRHDEVSSPASRIVFFDSGGGSLPQQITQSQLDWFALTNNARGNIPVVAFVHIPTHEFQHSSSLCHGQADDGVSPPKKGDAGLVETLVQAGNVHVVAVGHDHGNDYCCPHGPTTTPVDNHSHSIKLHLCFGRHSGYGGYGTWARGARVYELILPQTQQRSFSWRSYVRMESGAIQDVYIPQ